MKIFVYSFVGEYYEGEDMSVIADFMKERC